MNQSTKIFIFPIVILLSITFLHGHEPNPSERWVSVTGNGVVDAEPDMATLRLGVVSTAKTSTLATESNSKSVRRIFKVLSEKGIQQDDYETTRFQLIPQRQYRKGQPPLITGYQVSNVLVVRIYNLDKVGEIMQAAIDAGGNNFESLVYSVDDTNELMEEARIRAVEDALEKAMALTEPLDAQVGPPLSIQELRRGGQPFHSPMRMESADALRSNVPVKGPSELSVACEVQVKFSLE